MKCPHCHREIEAQAGIPGTVPPVGEERGGYPLAFEEAWRPYPKEKRGNKYPAFRAWLKQRPERKAYLEGLSRALNSQQWRSGFIPHMSTWINARGWEDEYPAVGRGYEKGDLR